MGREQEWTKETENKQLKRWEVKKPEYDIEIKERVFSKTSGWVTGSNIA